ncbi:MAG TPA: TetR/AcrR family transcriptional regulator [Myxococcaceae bacterium]|nr:TetR/AcrR family transcriptional regulator [Myxococcaceae bacterium]
MSKGDVTRDRILGQAFRLASRDGLQGLSIGGLAESLGMSKSGLFAHFGSKEDLQLEVLRAAARRFEDVVVRPAFRAPRGTPRLRQLFDNWLGWASSPDTAFGCLFVTAAVELDDRPGPARDFVVETQKQLLDALARSARMAIETGHFRANLDCRQFAFELYGLLLGYHHAKRLLRDPGAEAAARTGFARMLADAAAPS